MAAKKRTSGRKRRPEVRPVDKHYKLLKQLYQPVVDARERFLRQIDDAEATYLRQRVSWTNQVRDLGLPNDGPSARLAYTCGDIAYAYGRLRHEPEPYNYLDLCGHFVYLDVYESLMPKARAEVAKAEARRERERTKAAKRA